MNEQAFGVLEYEDLRALVRRGAQTEMGRARADALGPLNDVEHVRRALAAVSECVELKRRGAGWSFSELAEPADALARLRIEGVVLDALTLLALARLCDQVGEARAQIHAERADAPVLWALVAELPRELYALAARVTAKILPSGELDDRASPELARIRHDINRLRSSITRALENLMHRTEEAIQDQLVTVRNERFVIPVRADHRGRVAGVAHGFSSSGATVFIEPLDTIESNNELQNLRETEEREITRILATLTDELRRELPALERAAEAVAELDFINAKAALARTFNCVSPLIDETGTLELIAARHPLLEENLRATNEQVVPVSLTLDAEHPVMVISGANAGGKTVVLKTAGLLSLMALSGLHVPAQTMRVPPYASVLADIGDRQSLAAHLSTFTAHIANISRMLDDCAAPALVLLDEVGTGTDPEEGSALGVAVVDHFKQRGAQVMATTHYSGLKIYAANESGVLNASVEFDEKTLQPTYRLLVGIAGSSSGLEIAQRFGIPAQVIGRAIEQVRGSSRASIEYLRRIKSEAEEAVSLRKQLAEERAAVAEKFAAIDEQAAKQEAVRQAELERELSRAVKEFEEHSHELVAKIEDRASRLKLDREAARRTAELKREAQLTAQAARKTGQAARASSSRSGPTLPGVRVVRDGQVVSDLPAEPDQTKSIQDRDARGSRQDIRGPQRDLKVGDRVRLLSFGSVGIINHIREDEAEARVCSLRMREKLEDLELVYEVNTASTSSRRDEVSTVRGSGRAGSSLEDMGRRAQTTEVHLHSRDADSKSRDATELNLIGKKTDEAVDLTDKFLDEAFLNGLSEVRIIHGHGTGALRRAIAELLADHPHVARFITAAQEKGGTGATVVELRK